MSWIEYQRSILADRERNEAFERALASRVVAGETTMVDIGSGSGFLSFLASRLGARDVLAVEHNAALYELSVKLARRNRIRNVQFINCNSAELTDMPPVDLVVSETLGNYALEENIVEIMNDARRFLRPGGTLIPGVIEQYVAPVVNPRFHAELTSWEDVGFNLDLSPAQAIGFNNLYVRRFLTSDLYSEPVRWDRVDLRRNCASLRRGEAQFTAEFPETVFGFAGWWRAELVPGIWLATGPADAPTHWEQIYFPIPQPIDARKGDGIRIAIRSDGRGGNGVLLAWTVTHVRRGKVLSKQSLDIRKGG
jgi:protein arginine N-methyltransferase 1